MSSPSPDDKNNQQQITNNKYPYCRACLCTNEEKLCSHTSTQGWSHSALSWNSIKPLQVLVYPTDLNNSLLNTEVVKETLKGEQ